MALRAVIGAARFELIPIRSAATAMVAVPAAAAVSVTCSPTKGLDPTLDLAAELTAAGHRAIPHLASRMVDGPDHVGAIPDRLAALDLREIFVIAGDAAKARGPYPGSVALLEQLLVRAPGVTHVGVAAYPDGHPLLDEEMLVAALLAKQDLLRRHGLSGHATTQMCFDADRVLRWLERVRAAGLELPIHLGVAGAVERTKLVSLGVRLGVGSSLRFLRKNTGLLKMFGSAAYDPGQVLDPLSPHLARLGVSGIHLFTFNQVDATRQWQAQRLAELAGSA